MKQSAYRPALTVLLIYLAAVTVQLGVSYDWDATGFLNFGSSTPPAPEGAYIESGSKGFDGAYYYVVAQDPLLVGEGAEQLEQLDAEYRAGRAVYPVTAYVLSFGSSAVLPWSMLVVNLAAVFLLAFVVAKWLISKEQSAWYAVAVGLLAGVAMAVMRDLTDASALAFTLSGLYFWRQRQFVGAAVVLSVATLTRETALLALLIPLWAVVTDRKQYPLKSLVVVLFPIGCFTAWQLYLAVRLGTVPIFSDMINQRQLPLIGQIDALSAISELSVGAQIWTVAYMVLITLTALIAVYVAVTQRSVFSLVLVVAGVLTLVAGSPYWEDPWSFVRAALPLTLFLFLYALESDQKQLMRFSLLPAVMTPLALVASLG